MCEFLYLQSIFKMFLFFLLSFHLPDILIWYFAITFDGTTFLLVFSPAGTLAGSVTVMSKFALAAPLELLLSAETAVANTLC